MFKYKHPTNAYSYLSIKRLISIERSEADVKGKISLSYLHKNIEQFGVSRLEVVRQCESQTYCDSFEELRVCD